MDNLSGREVKGYQLLERIGAGGFGAVYKAHQSTIGREVAMKIILPHFANHPDFIRRFETEAQLVARLEHLHIVPLFDYWRDPEGAYLVMRWLRGGSLREALNEKRFEIEASSLLLDQIAAALAVAHRNNVIHRDLKPGNILLDEDGNAYLADFGIAKDASTLGITEVDAIVGSPDYLAPEQANGEAVSPRTDIYSLGVVLYEMLTGQHPFPNLNTVERLYKHLSEPLPEITILPDDVCVEVNAVIQKATAKNPACRYSDAMALAAAFREAIKLHQTENLVETLTQREQEILSRIIVGMSNQQIAEELVITVGTVKWYVNQIFRKLNVRSRVQAIVKARELHLIVSGNGTATLAPSILTEDFQPENPYKGLQAFQAADNQDFFGREKLVQKLVARLTESGDSARFLAVVGPSGSGKSSLVKAGLIPALWRGDIKGSEKWFVAEMLPGSHPLDELEVALMRVATKPNVNLREQLGRDERGLLRAIQLILPEDGSEIVLVIDQFEEVFTLVEDEAARQHFLRILLSTVSDPRSRMRLIITLRADFYDRPLHYSDFGELMRTRTETVLPLGVEGLERAIARPAERVGAIFEPGLVAVIVGDVHYQPGALPLLQYALMELFEQRQGRILTHEAYQSIGGTVGALAKRAEDIYDELSPEAQQITQQMFLRLVTLGEGTEDTRRRAPRSELLALTPGADMMDEVIDTFAAYRLLSLDNDPGTRSPTVEVAHEAILREWERLRVWINDNREEIKMQQQLAYIAEEWLISNRDTSFLASGLRLEQFEKWVQDTTQPLTPDEQAFLNASLAERTRLANAEVQRQQREVKLERRSQTFLRGLVAVLILATVGAFGLTGFAVSQANVAQQERDTAQVEKDRAESQARIAAQERERAEQQSRIAQSRELVGYANGTLETDAELTTLLALQAVNTTYKADGAALPEAETLLHQAVQRLNPPLRLPAAHYEWLIYGGLNLTRDGSRIVYMTESAYEGRTGKTAIANPATGEVLYTISGELVSLSFGDYVVTWFEAENDTVIFQYWDISSEQTPQMIASYTSELSRSELDRIEWIDFSPDFRYAAIYLNAINRVFDLSTGEEITELVDLPPSKGFTQFSPDSQLMAHINPDRTLSILETGTWMEIARISSPGTSVTYFKFSPSGTSLILANADNTVSVWETNGFTELYTVSPGIPTQRLAFSSDGTSLAIASVSGQVIIWNTVAQQEHLHMSIGANVAEIAFDADSTRLISYHTDGQLRIWNLVPGQEYLTMLNDPIMDSGPSGLAYSPDGERLVVGSMSATPTVWNAHTGQRIFDLSGHSSRVLSTAWSPDGSTIATAGEDTDVILWDAATGESMITLSGHSDSIYGLAFSPDNRRVASSGYDQTVRIWEVATGELLLTLEQPAWSKGVAFSPDGTRIAAGTDKVGLEGHLRVWDSTTGELQFDVSVGNTRTGSVTFSPDGSHILLGLLEAHNALVIDVQSGEILRTLSDHTMIVASAAYSTDGTRIATASHDGTVVLWDAATGQQLLTLYNTSSVNRVVFSSDGEYLATQEHDGTTRIYILSLPELMTLAQSRLTRWWTDAECQRYLHTVTCPEEPQLEATPQEIEISQNAVIPDDIQSSETSENSQLLVWSWSYGRQDNADEIYLLNADGSNPVNLTNNPGFDGMPDWSPDGTQVAFSSDRDRDREIYVMNADGSNVMRLTNSPGLDEVPAWSPDGTKIAFQSMRDGNYEIYAMDADGSNVIRLTDNRAADELPAWSPDGTQIAFSSLRDGNYEAYIMNADGSNLINLTNNPAEDLYVAWSPDGTHLAFSSDRDGADLELYMMHADGGNPTRLTDNENNDLEPAWSPDETQIAYSLEQNSSGVLYLYDLNTERSIQLGDSDRSGGWPRWRPEGASAED